MISWDARLVESPVSTRVPSGSIPAGCRPGPPPSATTSDRSSRRGALISRFYAPKPYPPKHSRQPRPPTVKQGLKGYYNPTLKISTLQSDRDISLSSILSERALAQEAAKFALDEMMKVHVPSQQESLPETPSRRCKRPMNPKNDAGMNQQPNINHGGLIFAQNDTNQYKDQGQDTGGGWSQGENGWSLFVNRKSIIAQMSDVMGNSKSQQVIMLGNMINMLETIL